MQRRSVHGGRPHLATDSWSPWLGRYFKRAQMTIRRRHCAPMAGGLVGAAARLASRRQIVAAETQCRCELLECPRVAGFPAALDLGQVGQGNAGARGQVAQR